MDNNFNTSFFRKLIFDSTNDEQLKFRYFTNIKKSLLMNDSSSVVYKYANLPILYLDSYKKLSNRVKGGFASPQEMQMFSVYNEVEDINSLTELYNKRHDYILYSIDCVRDFYEMPLLGKIHLIKQLSEYENYELSSFSKYHDEDLNNYNIEINEDMLYNFYKRYSKKMDELELCYDELSIFNMIAGFIQKMYPYDTERIYDLICRISESVFTNIDLFMEKINANDKYISDLKETYYADSINFNNFCLYDNGTLVDLITIYMNMRNVNLAKNKIYKKEKDE